MAQILVFSVVGTTFVSLVISLSLRRDTGELKRKRGTPVSPVVILGGIVGNGVLMALFMSALVIAISVIVFGAEVDLARLPILLLTLVTGSLAFCALGAAVAAFVPNGDAAPAFANLTIFPLYFISGVFIPDVPEPSPASPATAAAAVPARTVEGVQPDRARSGRLGQPGSRRGVGTLRGRDRPAVLPLGAEALATRAAALRITRARAAARPERRRANRRNP